MIFDYLTSSFKNPLLILFDAETVRQNKFVYCEMIFVSMGLKQNKQIKLYDKRGHYICTCLIPPELSMKSQDLAAIYQGELLIYQEQENNNDDQQKNQQEKTRPRAIFPN